MSNTMGGNKGDNNIEARESYEKKINAFQTKLKYINEYLRKHTIKSLEDGFNKNQISDEKIIGTFTEIENSYIDTYKNLLHKEKLVNRKVFEEYCEKKGHKILLDISEKYLSQDDIFGSKYGLSQENYLNKKYLLVTLDSEPNNIIFLKKGTWLGKCKEVVDEFKKRLDDIRVGRPVYGY